MGLLNRFDIQTRQSHTDEALAGLYINLSHIWLISHLIFRTYNCIIYTEHTNVCKIRR